ncbi:DUF1513 domain-containing protein [Pelagibius sp. CAU 1746]|uniref:DUF1513 domain-containing protein n=1 Tax=Pelagibius sp. CAU 1746 TaxID=3140370 RepID=UPI00325B52AB
MTAIERRHFLAAAAGLLAAGGLRWTGAEAASSARYVVSACAAGDGGTLARVVRDDGHVVATLPLPGRGHGAARRPAMREVVVFARRPGRFALAFDPLSPDPARRIDAPPGHHFYGHGVFSPDGRWLFACENDYGKGRGRIGVYDADAAYRRESELEAYAIGPHEMVLMSDGRTLAVANGGILTHPDKGRRKLNIDSMQPALTYIDTASGALLHDHRLAPDLHQLSIRHLAVTSDDEVGFVMQFEGPRNRLVPLVGLHRGEEEIFLPEADETVLRAMRQYCGSAAVDVSGRVLAASAPRGGCVTFWSMAGCSYLGAVELSDGCGVAASGGPGGFLLSNGHGRLLRYNALSGEMRRLDDPAAMPVLWDNHLLAFAL